MIVHPLKCWPAYFAAVENGTKPFEARRDDRSPPFEAGQSICLHEWDPVAHQYTGRSCMKLITYVLRGTEHLAPGFCVLGLGDPQ